MKSYFREKADSGVWCAVLIPLAVSVTSFKLTFDTDLSTVILSIYLAVYSSIFHTASKTRSLAHNLTLDGVGFIFFASIAQSFLLPLHKIAVNATSLLIYVFFLPKLFITCPKSFTLGEGCLVLQSTVLFVSRAPNILTAEANDITRYI